MKDFMKKRFRVDFVWEVAMNHFYFDDLKRAKKFILNWLSPGTVLDLDFILIWDNGHLVKKYNGDRLFQRYFRI